jgi:hypothetical protein
MSASDTLKNFWNKMSPEARLLLKSAKFDLLESEIRELKGIIAGGVDWGKFETIALNTKLGALCFNTLVKKYNLNIPSETANFLNGIYTKIVANNIVVLNGFSNLKEFLNRAQIDYIPLKGIKIIEDVYPDLGLRFVGDIDLLFKAEDTSKIRHFFRENNYYEYVVDESARIRKWTENPSPYQYSFNNIAVDFHIRLNRVGVVSLNISDFWKDATKVHKHEYELDDTHEFIHLCFHCYKHLVGNSQNLIWFLELYFFLERKKVSWDKFIEYSDKYNCLSENTSLVQLLEVLFEKKLMDSVVKIENRLILEKCISKIHHCLFPDFSTNEKDNLKSKLLFETDHLSTTKKLIVLFDRLFPSREFLHSRYGRVDNYFWVLIKRYTVYVKR